MSGPQLVSHTRRAYVAGWKHFTSWCIEHLVEIEGRTLPTVLLRLGGPGVAGQGHAKAPGQGVRQAPQVGQWFTSLTLLSDRLSKLSMGGALLWDMSWDR